MKFIQDLYDYIKVMLNKIRTSTINELQTHYNPLSPTDNAEECEVYMDSLKWALDNKKHIKNIAVAGSYGSGKSSLLKTFIKKQNATEHFIKRWIAPEYKFLNISLAAFKDANSELNPNPNNNELLRLIELSILQQLFFHEKDSKIPDSRFKKIKNQKRIKLVAYTIGFIVLINAVLFLLNPNFLAKFTILNIPSEFYTTMNFIATAVTLIGLFFILYKSSRSLIGMSIKKLSVNNATIEIDEGISKSILNNHLDEIIYFFDVTKYNVLIIEDLDRFEQSEVFTKLREINLLINSSNKIKRDVVFVYAIKDDMFKDKDRTKFFDFMIPIIPVVNNSNSGAKLRKIVDQNKYKIKVELLDDLSLFIDDMRLLYNIMNEYYIYSKKVNENLDQNRLLSMIVYKNIFPNDFTLLSHNDGDLYKTIAKKTEYIRSEIIELDNQIEKIRKQVRSALQHNINDLNELRILYITKVIDKISNGFCGLSVDNQILKISDFTKTENFNKIKSGTVKYSFWDRNYNRARENTFSFKFSDIENEVNPDLTYNERESLITTSARINNLKKEIEKLNEQKFQTQKSNLKDLITGKKVSIESTENKKSNLISLLLRNGYIDENYMDYISIFHDGALTKSDYQFLINVKIEKRSAFDYTLVKTTELIKKINEYAFEKEYILNFNLVDTVLRYSTENNKKQFLLKQLSNENKISTEFIDKFIDKSVNIELFIIELCKNWTNIWNYIQSESFYSDEKMEKYFNLIIQYADVESIVDVFKENIEYLNNISRFLKIQTEDNKIEQILSALDLKFNNIDVDSPKTKLNYLFGNNHYAINVEMIRILISLNNDFDSDNFEEANYSYILSGGGQELIDYIELNITEYVRNVYLKLENNKEEEHDNYIKLLNHAELDSNLKANIIQQVNTTIDNILDIEDSDVQELLFEYSKVKPKWTNILEKFKFDENVVSKEVLEYLNSIPNSKVLSKSRMTTSKNNKGITTYAKLCNAIIHESKLSIEVYKLLTISIPFWYESFTAEKVSSEKIIILIENRGVQPTVKSYEFLKKNYKGTNILLLEKYSSDFKKLLNEISINKDDLELILRSNEIDNTMKISIVNSCENEIIIDSKESSEMLLQILVDSNELEVNQPLLLLLINKNNISTPNRIKLFNKNTTVIGTGLIANFLISLGGKYEEINDTSMKATLDNNMLNETFLNNLKKIEYISSVSIIDKGLRVNHKRKE